MKVAYIEQCAILCVPCLSIYRRFEQAREHLWRRRSCTRPAGSILACTSCSLQFHTDGGWIHSLSQRWIVDFAQRVLAVLRNAFGSRVRPCGAARMSCLYCV